jgi:hypothetical protein
MGKTIHQQLDTSQLKRLMVHVILLKLEINPPPMTPSTAAVQKLIHTELILQPATDEAVEVTLSSPRQELEEYRQKVATNDGRQSVQRPSSMVKKGQVQTTSCYCKSIFCNATIFCLF